ncbi:hypothetical protein LF1_17050 [Rubripirellula obstinata]|uniref:Uncharacterized protein n=1 Tax=Rubripirellula obstinata TaxID=406547 RepID=A0A5B1CF48_9BACT|nr:hypothetical protein [Rubripirellula obstinata]KAA1259176.1 hypothetical protein LF1_17050 [Rubripirellula obstinata]
MKKKNLLIVVAVVFLLIAGIAVWLLRSVDHPALGQATRSFVVDCSFDKFRQIMIRKNATKAIVGDSGMRLLDERILDVDLDTSKDDRPFLNAIRGRSKTDLAAVKELTVGLDDPMLEADELVLRQNADIDDTSMKVRTVSRRAAGRLEEYETTFDAIADEDGTRITLSVTMKVRVAVPNYFRHLADDGVQQAADEAIDGQQKSISEFIELYADERFIFPDLKR